MAERLAGEVSINDSLVYSGIAPRISEQGLEINRLRPKEPSHDILETEGPHIHIYPIVPNLLMNLAVEDFSNTLRFSFSGPCLGHISMLSGYPAAEFGSLTRAIKTLSWVIETPSTGFRFEISGATGRVLHWSQGIKKQNDPHLLVEQTFSVWFLMTSDALSRVIRHRGCADALAKKLAIYIGDNDGMDG